MNNEEQRLLREASEIWAPDFPRKASNESYVQSWVNDRDALVESLRKAASASKAGYISTYSFPRGHSKAGNIPDVNGIFIDLDVPGGDYDPDTGEGGLDAWKRDMSALLARARMIARAIIAEERQNNFLVSLSGHKGVHIDLVFPTLSPDEGTFQQFKTGLSAYGDEVVEWLRDISGGVDIDPWVDVDSSDLGRLRRMPNTPHFGVNHTDAPKWCVPVSVKELASMKPDDYLAATDSPREIPDGVSRNPMTRAGDLVKQRIRTAQKNDYSSGGTTTTSDPRAIKEYKKESNDKIGIDDIEFLTSERPCVWAFRERDDAYDYGDASRQMEINVMARLIQLRVPIDVMHEFFEAIPGYDEGTTQELIEDIIGRGENGYKSFNCDTVTSRSQQFCLGSECSIYRRNDDLQIV